MPNQVTGSGTLHFKFEASSPKKILMRKIIIKKGLIVPTTFILLLLASVVDNVLFRPFPFLDILYTTSETEFNSQPNNLPISLDVHHNIKKDFSHQLKYPPTKDITNWKENIYKATDITRSIQRKAEGKKIRSIEDAFTTDSRFMPVCSESSKIFTLLMVLQGIPSRVIWMNGHTVSEIWNGSKWILVDTHGNTMIKDNNGNYLSATEARIYSPTLIYERISNVTGGKLNDFTRDGTLKTDNPYTKQGLFIAIDNPSIFTFHTETRIPSNILRSLINLEPEKIGFGIQFLTDDSKMVGNFGINLTRRLQQSPHFQHR